MMVVSQKVCNFRQILESCKTNFYTLLGRVSYDVNRGASVFIWFPLYQLTSKASIVMPRAL